MTITRGLGLSFPSNRINYGFRSALSQTSWQGHQREEKKKSMARSRHCKDVGELGQLSAPRATPNSPNPPSHASCKPSKFCRLYLVVSAHYSLSFPPQRNGDLPLTVDPYIVILTCPLPGNNAL